MSERRPTYTVESIKGGRLEDAIAEARAVRLAMNAKRDTQESDRLALLESLLVAARAWDKSGRWQDYQTLHEAIKGLEDEDA